MPSQTGMAGTRGPANAPVRAAHFFAAGGVTLNVELLRNCPPRAYTSVKSFCSKLTFMRAVIAVFVITLAVVWDAGQNNGHYIRSVSSGVYQTMRAIGIL